MTEADWLKQILARPHDRTTRLVYADWLEDRGEGVKAAVIRAEGPPLAFNCWGYGERFRLRWYVKGGPHVPRGFAAWLRSAVPPPADGHFSAGEFRRGLLDLCAPLDWWLEHGPAVVRAVPVEEVRVVEAEARLAGLEPVAGVPSGVNVLYGRGAIARHPWLAPLSGHYPDAAAARRDLSAALLAEIRHG